jgi:hypothetical protein
MLAMLWAVLAPSLSYATAANRGEILIPMCSVSGGTQVTLPGDPAKPSTPAAPEHCKLCSLHGDSYAPPPTVPPMLFPIDAGERYPTLFFQSSSPLAVWSPVQSRAPPAGA